MIAFPAACVEKQVQTDEMSSKLPHALSIKVNTKEPYFPRLHADGSSQIAGWVFLVVASPTRRQKMPSRSGTNQGQMPTQLSTPHVTLMTRPRDAAGQFRIDESDPSWQDYLSRFVYSLHRTWGTRPSTNVTLAEAGCFMTKLAQREQRLLNCIEQSVCAELHHCTSPMLIITHPCRFVKS
jgi:hypothetical protein